MFGIGGFELFLILIFGFLIFGPDKLPAIAKTIGKAIAKFRSAQEDMSEQLKTATFIDKDSDAPLKNPLEVLETAAVDAQGKAKTARKKADEVTEKVTQASEHAESFAERKARYDRERAERKKAEAAAEAAAAEKVSAPKPDPTSDLPAKTVVDAEET